MTSSGGHTGLSHFPYHLLYAALLIGQALAMVALVVYRSR